MPFLNVKPFNFFSLPSFMTQKGTRVVFPNCRQFHQRFTSAFFVQNFGAKNYEAVFLV